MGLTKAAKCPCCGKTATSEIVINLLGKELMACSECGVVFVPK